MNTTTWDFSWVLKIAIKSMKWGETGVNSLSNRTALSFMKDLMRSLIAEALAGSMIQYFHGGCKLSPG